MGKALTKHKGHSKLKDEPSNTYDDHEGQALTKDMEKTQVCQHYYFISKPF